MKKTIEKYSEIDIFSIEKEIGEIAPLFADISEQEKLGSPADSIVQAIYAAADKQNMRRRFERKLCKIMRVAAAAAALFLVVNGGIRITKHQENNRRQEVLNQLAIVSSEDNVIQQDMQEPSNVALAEMLMEMQGLDEETYFAVN